MVFFQDLFKKYDRLFFFDTETTGLRASRDQIIEFASVVVENQDGEPKIAWAYDQLLTLYPGTSIPPNITELTHISNELVAQCGIPKEQVCKDIANMISSPNTLLIAYNANFDLCFTYYLLAAHGDPSILQGKDKLDLLTVYKDRTCYPHRLENAIEFFGLSKMVKNSHRAVDDVKATVEVMKMLELDRNDLLSYVNLFGFNPKYGPPRDRIRSVTYKAQPYDSPIPLYEL